MAEERLTTPEKQLLKLIEDPKNGSFSSRGIKQKGRILFSVAALKGRLSFLKERLSSGFTFSAATFDIKVVNNVLAVFIFVFTLFLIVNLTISFMDLNKIPELSLEAASSIEIGSPKDIALLKLPNYYLEKARSRDIFKFGRFFQQLVEEKEVLEVVAPIEEDLGPTKEEIIMDRFSLVGIAWSDDPDAMIEDVNTQKIYFLKRGDSIEDVKIQAILRDRVVLLFEGEEVELR